MLSTSLPRSILYYSNHLTSLLRWYKFSPLGKIVIMFFPAVQIVLRDRTRLVLMPWNKWFIATAESCAAMPTTCPALWYMIHPRSQSSKIGITQSPDNPYWSEALPSTLLAARAPPFRRSRDGKGWWQKQAEGCKPWTDRVSISIFMIVA